MREEPPLLKRTGPVPISEQIAAWLRQRIQAGDFVPDEDPLPSENQLMEMFDVSRDTARRVHDKLVGEGLAYTVPARGTFVHADAVGRRGGRQQLPEPVRHRRRGNGSTGPPKSSRARTRLLLTDGGLRSCRHVWATRPLSRFMFNDIPYAGMHPHTGARQEFM